MTCCRHADEARRGHGTLFGLFECRMFLKGAEGTGWCEKGAAGFLKAQMGRDGTTRVMLGF